MVASPLNKRQQGTAYLRRMFRHAPERSCELSTPVAEPRPFSMSPIMHSFPPEGKAAPQAIMQKTYLSIGLSRAWYRIGLFEGRVKDIDIDALTHSPAGSTVVEAERIEFADLAQCRAPGHCLLVLGPMPRPLRQKTRRFRRCALPCRPCSWQCLCFCRGCRILEAIAAARIRTACNVLGNFQRDIH